MYLCGLNFSQEVSGIHIFTGSTAVKWFMKNMEGVTSVQVARVCIFYFTSASSTFASTNIHTPVPIILFQNVGQRLMDLNVFTEIQG